MWVFGYGSLVWKVDFKYECKLVGYLKGYLRRFYQHSIDHRGVPEKPGRVVTLIPSNDPDSSVWGVAYKINEEDIEQVTTHLDYREKNGYSKKTVTFHPKDPSWQPFELTLYVAMKDNESYAGAASIGDLAKQVLSCSGPSGSNKEYVYNLAEAMRQLAPGVEDEHLFSLEAAVRKLDPDMRKNS
ncbi:putative glutathione-specific gamma-glutamylcyclotransferase 2 [Maniola jurtina]|uniref:putative glutathione-specific gamma-glutamylcyclotransferase 2 n=1 Tax=Maniola jurtina TaxID=191418 RepID=UPI001E68A204|nr:putative glutathione-specific gamma-glutamylcyclotransferase 2 [Maniola jurtina]XP_045779169.1 putative glutathione-specific gamma-glutamylcyclotransferase 2 [Maniola jurtina]